MTNSNRTAICFLVINKMLELPEIAIKSALERTQSDIYLGFIRTEDLPDLPKSERIKLIKLQAQGFDSDREVNYQTFAEDTFYQIVRYKWLLFSQVAKLGREFIVYSDTDVYWNRNPIPELEEAFDKFSKLNIQIQSFTDSLLDPKLCMGFVAVRNCHETSEFLNLCEAKHRELSESGRRIGDDDVVTLMYKSLGQPHWLVELPQTTFPVGRMMKLFARNSLYPGLPGPSPFIFHANYVIGLRNKIVLLKLFVTNYADNRSDVRMELKDRVYLLLQQARLIMHRVKLRLK